MMKEKQIITLISSWQEKKMKQPKYTSKANKEIIRLKGMLKKEKFLINGSSKNKRKRLNLELKKYSISTRSNGNIDRGKQAIFMSEKVLQRNIKNHIGKHIHKQLVLGYGELSNNPQALRKLNDYYTKFQEETYSDIKSKYPNIDKTMFRRIFLTGMIGWIQRAGSTILHESGHFHTAKRNGLNSYLGYSDKNGREVNNITSLDQFLATLLNKGRAHVGYSSNNKKMSIQEHAEITGNGINQNIQYSRDIYEDILLKGGKYSFIKNIKMNSNGLYGLGYILSADTNDSFDDPTSYLKSINSMNGTNYTIKDLRNYSLLSLLSGSTISGAKDGISYIWSGKKQGKLLGFKTKYGKVMLPEFHTWLGKNGVSIEMTNYIKTNNSVYKLGFNSGVMGNKSNTMILGVTRNWKQIQMSAQGSIGDHPGIEFGIRRINKNTSFYAKGGYSENENMFDKTRERGGYGEIGVSIDF